MLNVFRLQGILGLAYPSIAKPSSDVEPWIDSLQKKSKDITMAFSLTLCGPKHIGENQHYGSFEILSNDQVIYSFYFYCDQIII